MLPGMRNQVLRRTQKRSFKMQATELLLLSEGVAGVVRNVSQQVSALRVMGAGFLVLEREVI